MKKLLFLLLAISTLCVKSQSNTSINPLNDTSFIRNFARLCVEHRNFKKVIAYQDSIIVAEKESLSLLGLQLESCMVENKILDLDSDQKSKVINSCYEDNTVLKTDKEKLERKLKRLKRQRWIFGGVGFVGGIALFLLI